MSALSWHPRCTASLLHPSQEGCSYLPSPATRTPRQSLQSRLPQSHRFRRQDKLAFSVKAEERQSRSDRDQAGSTKTYKQSWERQSQYDYPPTPSSSRPPPSGPPPPNNNNGNGFGSDFTKALLAGVFILGIGTGVWFDSQVSLYPSNVASTEIIDRKTPNSEVCMASGYSSMVFDQRIFVSFSP